MTSRQNICHQQFLRIGANDPQEKGWWYTHTFRSFVQMLVRTMEDYPVVNAPFHTADDVNDHATWAMYAMEEFWLSRNTESTFCSGLDATQHNTALLAAFLHDVGKTGDADHVSLVNPGWKEEHPNAGFRMLTGQTMYNAQSEGQNLTTIEINLWDQMRKSGIPYSDCVAMVVAAGMHYAFGNLVVQSTPPKYQEYASKFLGMVEEVVTLKTPSPGTWTLQAMVRLCVAVSAADVRGTNPILCPSQYVAWIKQPVTHFASPKESNYDRFRYQANLRHVPLILKAVQGACDNYATGMTFR